MATMVRVTSAAAPEKQREIRVDRDRVVFVQVAARPSGARLEIHLDTGQVLTAPRGFTVEDWDRAAAAAEVQPQ